MDLDLPALAAFLSQPISSVEVALPVSLGGRWPYPSKLRTNFAAVRSDSGTLFLHHRLVSDSLLNGLWDDEPFEGYLFEGTLTLLVDDTRAAERDLLASRGWLELSEPYEMISLGELFPDAGRIYVPDETACELSYTQTIRAGVFRFDVSGLRIHSSEASTFIERGFGGALECSVQP